MAELTPDHASLDHGQMAPYWAKVDAILAGTDAMRTAGQVYLPKFPAEPQGAYDHRRKTAPFTNVFRDIVENLAQRPFSKKVEVADGAPSQIMDLAEDIDARGNSLHVFAGETFFSGITHAVDWVLVDYTAEVQPGATLADEARIGARPYWVKISAPDILAVHSDIVAGKEGFVHVRIRETELVRDGFGETAVERVRVLHREKLGPGNYAPATWELWEKQKTADGTEAWVQVRPPTPISIGVIALVPFIAGRRIGSTWQFHPPMRDAADLQIELFQQESALKHIKEMTAFPMLAGNGVSMPVGDDGLAASPILGPMAILTAPEGSWAFIEPGSESLRFLADHIKETTQQLRELGRQPLTAQSGNLTVVTTAFAAQKGNAAIQAWALNLRDALEQALIFTGMWLGLKIEPSVMIDTDFDLGLGDDDSFKNVLELKKGGAISRKATIHEAKRRNILAPDYDPDDDMDEILIDESGHYLEDDEPPTEKDDEDDQLTA